MRILRVPQAAVAPHVGNKARRSTLLAPLRPRPITTATVFSLSAMALWPLTAVHCTPAPKTQQQKQAQVRVETAILRAGPSEQRSKTALLDAGQVARVLEQKGEWLRVRLATGTEGWVRVDLVRVSHRKPVAPVTDVALLSGKKKAPALAAAPAKNKKMAAAVLPQKPRFFVRGGSSAAAAFAARFVAAKPAQPADRPVTARALGLNAARLLVDNAPRSVEVAPATEAAEAIPTRAEAVVETRAIPAVPIDAAPTLVAPAPLRTLVGTPPFSPQSLSRGETMVRSALAYRGTPYRFGARGGGAFDCSGFTSYLFAKAGSPLPRTAAQQFKKGTPIPKGQLQPGDLVFFKNTYKRGISHVGVYIGENRFVHAASTGRGVVVDALSTPHYAKHWAGARRLR